MRICGIGLFNRNSAGELILASYHPRTSTTWHWSVLITHRQPDSQPHKAFIRTGQWHDYHWLPFGFRLVVSRQDHHKGRLAQ